MHLAAASRLLASTAVITGLLLAAPAALRAEPVRNVLLTPQEQSAFPEQLLPQRMSARVERANGEPVVGAIVVFEINSCIDVATPVPGTECPVGAEYGGFDTGASPRPQLVQVTTDANGVATAPDFRVGTPLPAHVPMVFEVFPFVPNQSVPGGITISLQDALNPIGGLTAAATTVVIRGGVATAEVPTLGGIATAVLVFLLAGLALTRLR